MGAKYASGEEPMVGDTVRPIQCGVERKVQAVHGKMISLAGSGEYFFSAISYSLVHRVGESTEEKLTCVPNKERLT